MAVVKKSALVMYSARQMFDLVNDVESYPEFLPWCGSTILLSRTEDKVCAELEVARLGVSQKFSTCNRMVPGVSMDIELVEGPFKHLKGGWVFKALREDACKVEHLLSLETADQLHDFMEFLLSTGKEAEAFRKACSSRLKRVSRMANGQISPR